MGKKEIEIKTWLTRDEMINYLRDLANCLAQGRVVLQRGNEYLELCPAQSMELELEGVQKKGVQKISLEISWRQVVLEPTDDPLRIASEPQLPAEPLPTDQEADPAAALGEPLSQAAAENPEELNEALPAEDKAKRHRPGRK